MAKFKKGDKVRVKLDYTDINTYKAGQIFTVKGTSDDCVIVDGDCIFESNLELLTEYTPITPKVGERYRVLKDMPGVNTFGRCKKDKIVTLWTDHNLTTDQHLPIWVTDNFGGSYNLAANDLTTEYLELVEEPRYMKAEFDIEPVFATIKPGQIIKADLKDISVTPQPIKKTIIQKTMNAFKKALLSADTKTLIKAVYMDDETLELTSKGQQALNFIVYEKYQKELVAAADADIKEAEAKKK